MPSLSTLSNFSSDVSDDKVVVSGLRHLAVKEYSVLAVMNFFLLACDGAVNYQCANSRPPLSSRDVLVPLLAHF